MPLITQATGQVPLGAELVRIDASAGPVRLALPPASGHVASTSGPTTVVKIDASPNWVIITPTSPDAIAPSTDPRTSFVILAQPGDSATLQSDGRNSWFISSLFSAFQPT